MLSAIGDRLMRAKERLRTKQKLASMLHEAQAMLEQEKRKCRRYEQTLASEKADVEKLEGFGLTGLFYSILGTKEKRIEQERQEYLAARLKHEECTRAVDEARQEVERLQNELASLTDVESEYDRLIEEKRRFLTKNGDQRAEALMNFSERLADLEADRKELREAVRAGETAQRSLEEVRSKLRSAEKWGTWDMLGGGMLATWAKHSKIDSAKEEAQVAQRHLRQFQEELADADDRLHITLGEIGGFLSFADYLLDGLIADWVVQSKVQKASEACSSTIQRVDAALRECRRRLAEAEKQMQDVDAERREFIEQA